MDVSVINVTPERAKSLYSLRWDKQRNINTNHVGFLASEMKRGRFEPATIELVYVMSTGEEVMIDGQHALKAIQACGKPQKMILRKRSVEEESEIPFVFSRIDVHRKRHLGDSLFAFDMGSKVNYRRTFLQRVSSAIKFINNDFGYSSVKEVAIEDSIKDILNWSEYTDRFLGVYELFPGESHEKIRYLNRSIMGVGLVLFRYIDDTDLVNEFLRGFIHGTGLGAGDSRLLARNKYNHIKLVEGAGSANVWKANQVARLLAWAWNTYYIGEKRTKVYIKNLGRTMPIELKGTKYYTGRQI